MADHTLTLTWIFQSTHSQRVRPIIDKQAAEIVWFQSTHSQRVRPTQLPLFRLNPEISIHALTKSATDLDYYLKVSTEISIHALTKSATYKIIKPSKAQAISIHALTKSATFISLN